MKTKQLLRVAVALTGIFVLVDSALAQNWTQVDAPSASWTSVACSADGTKWAATCYPGIYTSTNSGTNWVQTSAPTNNWYAIASSTDGRKLVAAVSSGGI